MDLTAGDVWWTKPDPGVGREQSGRLPVVVVSGGLYNESVTTLALVAPLTTRDSGWPNHVDIRGPVGLKQPTFAMTEQVRVVARERLERRVGHATPDCVEAIRDWVRGYLVD